MPPADSREATDLASVAAAATEPGSVASAGASTTAAPESQPAPPLLPPSSSSLSSTPLPAGTLSSSLPPPPPPPPSSAAAAAAAATTTTTTTSSFTFPHYYHFPPMFTLQPNLATRRAQMDKWSALVLAYCRHYRIFRLLLSSSSSVGSTLGPTGTAAGTTAPGPQRIDSEGAGAGAGDDDDDTPRSVPYYAPDLFRNPAIDRALTPAATREVLEAMRRQGRVEWTDGDSSGSGGGGGGGGGGGAGSTASSGADLSSGSAAVPSSCYVYWKTPEEWAALVDAWIDETAQRGSVLTLYELTAGDAVRGTDLFGLDPVVLQRALAVLVKRGRAQVFGAAESLGVKFF